MVGGRALRRALRHPLVGWGIVLLMIPPVLAWGTLRVVAEKLRPRDRRSR